MAKKLTAKQVERYLTSENPEIRLRWAEKTDYTPTPEQIERDVRLAWEKRLEAMKHAQEKAVDEMLDDIVEF